MYKTVVLDGEESLSAERAVGSYIVDCAAAEVSITTDGGGEVFISGSAGASVEVVCDGEVGTVTEVIGGEFPRYEGNYVVTPTMSQQKLETKNRVLSDDITVKKIPLYETTNLSGGTTVYIAMGDE